MNAIKPMQSNEYMIWKALPPGQRTTTENWAVKFGGERFPTWFNRKMDAMAYIESRNGVKYNA